MQRKSEIQGETKKQTSILLRVGTKTSRSRTKSEGGSTWGETDELAEDETVSTRHRWRRLSHQHRGCGLVEGRGHRKAGSRVHLYKRQKQKQKLKGWHKNIYAYMGGRLFECQPLLDSSSTSVQMSLICFKINKVTNNGETISWRDVRWK